MSSASLEQSAYQSLRRTNPITLIDMNFYVSHLQDAIDFETGSNGKEQEKLNTSKERTNPRGDEFGQKHILV